ncbi:DUF418 domain-containing protein [Pseudoduganella plicata]|nr:DUF418 domain-containing protein [Pseudoduganella plicata]
MLLHNIEHITGASACLLIGIALALLRGGPSAWWLRHCRPGPLEALWHRATWIGAPNQASSNHSTRP